MKRRGFGDAELRRFDDSFGTVIAAETAKYGEQGREMLRDVARYSPSVLEMYVLMHRLRRETVLLVGTALVNAGWTLEDARNIENALNEILGE